MDAIVKFTRGVWAAVPAWIRDEDYWTGEPGGAFRYGLPPRVRHLIDLPIDDAPTEADVICDLLVPATPAKPVRYLEIGVSVGKTLFAVSRYVAARLPPGSTVTGIDIEPVNPVLRDLLGAAFGDPVVDDTGRSTTWGDVTYVQGNEFDPEVWDALHGPFDVIFSDAEHEPSALRAEYAFIVQHGLLNPDGFAYCFDDLDTRDLLDAAEAIAMDLGRRFPDMDIDAVLTNTPGWMGQHEYVHNFGIIKGTPRRA